MPEVNAGQPVDQPRTLVDKIWDSHVVVDETAATPGVLYVDLHLVHEVTSPQAFEGLRAAGRRVRRPDRTIATIRGRYPRANSGPSRERQFKRER